MIINHQCKVISVYQPDTPITSVGDGKSVPLEKIYRCNLSDHNRVKELRNEVVENDGPIDILIENGKVATNGSMLSIFSFPPERFIEETSNKIMITINVSGLGDKHAWLLIPTQNYRLVQTPLR